LGFMELSAETIKDIQKARNEAKRGKVKPISEIKKELKI